MKPFAPTIREIPGLTGLLPIAKGGMAEIYRARRVEDDADVAIKVMTEQAMDNPATIDRFEREAQTLKELDHPNIVRGYGMGLVDDRPYIVMEFVEGTNTMDMIAGEGPFDVGRALDIVEQVCRALSYAHGQGFIHRDVKPSNILLAGGKVAKLSDFGLAKLEGDFSLTLDGAVLGTPHYLAPEQISGAPSVDARADIYSLGMTLYYLVVGSPAFQGPTMPAVLTRHLTDEISFSATLRELLPERLILLIRRMAAKAPERRYASVDDVLRDLDWVRGEVDNPVAPLNEAESDYYVQEWAHAPAAECADSDAAPCHLVPDIPELLVDIAEGQVLSYEDEIADAVYWLVSGEIEVLRGGRRVAVIREPGTILGEMAALSRSKRPVTLRALADSQLIKVGAMDFTNFLTEHPGVMREMLHEMAGRVENANDRLMQSEQTLGSLRRTLVAVADGLQTGDFPPDEAAALLKELLSDG